MIGILNESGAELVRYDYEPYGYPRKTTYASGISALDRRACERNPIRRKGYYLDQSTGFYYLQSRYYSPYAARFLTSDDPAYLGYDKSFLSFNLFSYCINNPINHFDPIGKWTFSISFGGYIGKGGGYSFSIGLAVDSNGDAALQLTYSTPKDEKTENTVIGASAEVGVTMQFTDLYTKNYKFRTPLKVFRK